VRESLLLAVIASECLSLRLMASFIRCTRAAAQHNEHYGRTLREYEILLAQAEADRRRLEVAEPALERHAVGRTVAEAQLRLVQRQLVEAHAAQDGALAVQLRAADERLSVLGSQLRLSREAQSALRHRLAATAAEAA
jgi:hypothetical protein